MKGSDLYPQDKEKSAEKYGAQIGNLAAVMAR